MRRTLTLVAWLLVALCALPSALLADQVDVAIKELSSSRVYVAPNLPDTNNETVGKLASLLNPKDHIVLVMLPEEGSSPEQLVRQIDEATNGQYIIGLTVGNEKVGFARNDPIASVVSNIMKRASSVSTSPSETLATFVGQVHVWQTANPEPEPVKPAPKKDKSSNSFVYFVFVAILTAVFSALGVAYSRKRKMTSDEQMQFESPAVVRVTLEELYSLREKINDYELRETLSTICRDSEEYFERLRMNGTDLDDPARWFSKQMTQLIKVMKTYVDIQDNPRYYPDPARHMRMGKDAATSFSEFVLKTIHEGTTEPGLRDYEIDAELLNIQRASAT